MNKLYVLIGCPGSGKSYFATHSHNLQDAIYVSRDDVRLSMISDTDKYFSKEDDVYDKFVQIIADNLNSGKDVIADATHLTYKSRKLLFNTIKAKYPNLKYKAIAIVMETSLKTSIEQNATRTGRRNVPNDVIKSMYNRFQFPLTKEGFSQIFKVNHGVVTEIEEVD